jgi:N-methylhydantoinase B
LPSSIRSQDPITFEVVRGALYAICEEMKSVMTRAAFSPLLSLSADLSCALLDADGDVVAQGNDIPVHLGAMPFSGRGILERMPAAGWKRGDAVLSNDPYAGGSHLPDMTLLTPIFDEAGVAGFAASRVHWPDIGGAAAGSSAVTDEIVKEGLRIPPVRIMREGLLDEGLRTLLFANVRVPGDRMGDFRAQVACNQRGVTRVEELVARYGGPAVRRIFAETQDYSEIQVRHELERMADGVYRATQHLDGDGYVEDAGDGRLGVTVTIEKIGTGIHCDFTGTAPQTRGPVNAPFSVTASSCYYVLLALAGGGVPPNSGAYRPIRITAPEGTLVNAAYPAPVVAANTEMSNRLVDLLLEALAPALPDRVVGGSYGSAGVFALGGWDPKRERRFVHLETTGGGMGASARGPGLSGHRVHMGNTMNLPVEAVESAMPLRIDAYALVDGSAGAGRWPGGMGVRRVMRAVADGIEFSLLCERARHPAHGVAGGRPGRVARFWIERRDGSTVSLSSKTPAGRLDAGDALWLETAGGGGWGEPGPDAPGEADAV